MENKHTEVNLTRDRLRELASLLRSALWLDMLTEAEVEGQVWGDPDFDPELQLGVEVDGGLVGALGGVVRQDRGTGTSVGYVKFVAVSPTYQRQGVGTSLLKRFEALLAARGVDTVRVSGSAPCYLWPGVDVCYTGAYCFFLKNGYTRYADAVNLRVDLATAPLDTEDDERFLASQGIVVRRMEPDDAEAVGNWIARAFGDNWRWETMASLRRSPPAVFIAIQPSAAAEERVVGFAAYAGNRRNWFGPMGTDPRVRKLGIGRTLLRLCLRDLREQGYLEAQISWAGPVPFYARTVNARMDRVFYLMHRSLKDGNT
ncbi:MAG: GNAT family N-acetyltransferase [Limnochordales bacterium]|nr:GNAT family N-acetyltransferase [Limnochordales bacterium]